MEPLNAILVMLLGVLVILVSIKLFIEDEKGVLSTIIGFTLLVTFTVGIVVLISKYYPELKDSVTTAIISGVYVIFLSISAVRTRDEGTLGAFCFLLGLIAAVVFLMSFFASVYDYLINL
jgi:hypothetical protein